MKRMFLLALPLAFFVACGGGGGASSGEDLGKKFFSAVQKGDAKGVFPTKATAKKMTEKLMDSAGDKEGGAEITDEMKKEFQKELDKQMEKYDEVVAQQAEALVKQYKDQFEGGTYVKTEVKEGPEMMGVKSGTLTIHFTDKDKKEQTAEVPFGAFDGKFFAGGGMGM